MGCKQSTPRSQFSEIVPAEPPASSLPPASVAPSRAVERDVSGRDGAPAALDPAALSPTKTSVAASRFKGRGPSQVGDVHPCFKDGLLYRIVQPNAWYFYNDTQEYEMHVTFHFGPDSEIVAIPPATLQLSAGDDRAFVVSAIVYPGETAPFIEGKYNGYKSSIAARPLSAEYRSKINAQSNQKVLRELDLIQKLSRGSKDVEQVLQLCVHQHVPFVDVSFPPLPPALSRPNVDPRAIPETSWKRPVEYLADGHTESLFCKGIHPNDIDQGQLGDCWLLCSIAALAEFPVKVEDLFCHPVSTDAARHEQAVGGYRVTLNKHGWWHVLIIDNYFPVIGAKPCFAKCIEDPAELWVSILEKAYAKLHGSYAAITGGDALQALQDLTGYPVYRFDEEWAESTTDGSKSDLLFQRLVTYDANRYLVNLNTPGHDATQYMGTAVKSNTRSQQERYRRAGLAMGHAYTALQAKFFPRHGLRLLQIRNPWGNGVEWTGPWCDGDKLWQDFPDVSAAVKYAPADDGTFWMAWEDAQEYFDGGGVCFSRFDWHDYRAKGRFENGFPNLVLEVHVTKVVRAYCILSQRDKRGLAASDPDSKYSAIMLSVSRSFVMSSQAAGSRGSGASRRPHQMIHLNSTGNPECPSEQFTFNYARDLGMLYEFRPEDSPYYVIPRIYDAGGNKDYVLGLISDTSIGGGSGVQVHFKTLPRTCRVFHNYPVFEAEGCTSLVTETQYNPEVGAPQTAERESF